VSRPPPDLSKAKTEEVFTVLPVEDGLRIDLFLRRRIPWRSREHLQKRIRMGSVLVDGEPPGKVSQTVREGSEVVVVLERVGIPFDPSTIPLEILHEDEHLLALDKPAGVVVHPVGLHQMDTIINALHHRYRRPNDPERDVVPKLAHRLDQNTSGVLLVAKRDDVRAELGRQFADREVEKQYLAIVRGVPEPRRGEIEAPIGPPLDPAKRVPMTVRDDGEPSLTLYETEEEFEDAALLRLFPRSGRTHQIRVHLQWLGTPLFADPLYGDGKPLVIDGEEVLTRFPLHSAALSFTHPGTAERTTIRAPLPRDMTRTLALMRGA
jgi:23S rRNA pseudouridine1911/1915/1917 synthase